MIHRVRKLLEDRPRDLCFFILGINTAYRANELLSFLVGDVQHLQPGDVIARKQSKTSKHRTATLNNTGYEAIQRWLALHPDPAPTAPLFPSSRGGGQMTVSWMNRSVKEWCANVGLQGQYGTHTLRKTWGYQQLRLNKETQPHMVMPLLMEAYGHYSQKQTLDYLCIQSDEVANLFMQVEL